VVDICRTLGVSRSTLYRSKEKDQPSPKVKPAGIATPKPAATGTKRKVSPKVKRQGNVK
jgi:predicted DNA-binding transcriptional regulator AlpA